MKDLTEAQKAYLAGFIDGEGCIRIAKQRQGGNHFEFSFQIYVIVTNTDLEILQYLKEMTGIGIIYVYKKSPTSGKGKWKPCHRWQIVSKQATELLKAIYPYIRLKKKQVDAVLSFPFTGSGKRRTQEDYDKQMKAFLAIKEMNKRGLGEPA